jgi:uncharacterized cupredoxin-like copper-binding protein
LPFSIVADNKANAKVFGQIRARWTERRKMRDLKGETMKPYQKSIFKADTYLMVLLVSLLVSTMGGSIRTTQAGHVDGNVSGPSPAQQGSPTPPTALAVSLTEFQIGMPTSLSAGIHSFNVSNNGQDEHNLAVEGQGIKTEFVTDLTSGQTQNMQVYLAPGTYTVYCPLGDHRGQGMETSLTVTSP